MKVFLAHFIIMGLVHKGNLKKYRDHGKTVDIHGKKYFSIYIVEHASV